MFLSLKHEAMAVSGIMIAHACKHISDLLMPLWQTLANSKFERDSSSIHAWLAIFQNTMEYSIPNTPFQIFQNTIAKGRFPVSRLSVIDVVSFQLGRVAYIPAYYTERDEME